MLVVAASQLGNPMVFFVLEVAGDGLLHGVLVGLVLFKGKYGSSRRIYCLSCYEKYSKLLLNLHPNITSKR